MDLSLIQTHLDNFVDTWEGWGKVLGGLDLLVANGGIKGLFSGLGDSFYNVYNGSSNLFTLSSK